MEENLRLVAQPVMERLAKACRETVNLGTLDGGEVVVIATVESFQSIRMASKVGNRRCMHTTALGKMLLSGLEEREIRRLTQLRGLPPLTGKSITTLAALLAEIRTVRRQEYAIDNQENELDGRCIAGPIFGQNEDIIAAMSVSGPAFRMDLQRLRSFRSVLRETCAARFPCAFRSKALEFWESFATASVSYPSSACLVKGNSWIRVSSFHNVEHPVRKPAYSADCVFDPVSCSSR